MQTALAPASISFSDLACGPEALARYFRILGDPTRLRIVEALLERERTVGELKEAV